MVWKMRFVPQVDFLPSLPYYSTLDRVSCDIRTGDFFEELNGWVRIDEQPSDTLF